MKVAIIGCGFVGQKRAQALGDNQLVLACDNDLAKAESLAAGYPGCVAASDWSVALAHSPADLAIVATPHHLLAAIVSGCLRARKHVLVEKPAGISCAELEAIAELAQESALKVRVGFNHRFHPAIKKAHEICQSGEIGPLMFVRGRYGHGGRLGYEREWRAQPDLSGGGELLDQGSHLIDLSAWFLGDFVDVHGFLPTYFWDMQVEDNAFIALTTADKQMAWLHATWTEWKNTFCFEIYGRTGKLQIDGLGGSYGTEQLTYYKMSPQMGPPETFNWQYSGKDESWGAELAEMELDIKMNRDCHPGLLEARKTLAIIEKLYAGKVAVPTTGGA